MLEFHPKDIGKCNFPSQDRFPKYVLNRSYILSQKKKSYQKGEKSYFFLKIRGYISPDNLNLRNRRAYKRRFTVGKTASL